MKKWVIAIVLVGTGAYFLGGTVQYKDDLYQGKTAQEWAKKANENQQMADINYRSYMEESKRAGACQDDPNSTACNPFNKFFVSTPTPTPETSNNIDSALPY